MIIHEPGIKFSNSEIYVSARVEFLVAIADMPETLWFRFPDSYKEYVTDSSNGFAASLLTLAMSLGEDIEIKGTISPRLLYGMKEYSRIFNIWFPKQTKIINIKCDNLKKQDKKENKRAVASSFSGGVDSFYTLWKHLPQNEKIPEYRISHTLFVHGFDIPLEDEKSYTVCKQAYEELMNNLGLKLLTVQTNARQFLDKKVDWAHLAHGSALAGVVLILEGLISCYFLPSSYPYKYLVPYGSHPLTDPLLSTETLEIIHDGVEKTRFQKTESITNFTQTYSYLRVCWQKPNGLINCCYCEKCIRTMLSLDLLGCLNNYSTFPYPLEGENIRNNRFEKDFFKVYIDVMKHAIYIKKYAIAYDIFYALCKNSIRLLTGKIGKMARWEKLKNRMFF